MSKILFINSVCYGSTGSICKNLYKVAQKNGHTCKILYGRGECPNEFDSVRIDSQFDFYKHVIKAVALDQMCYGSTKPTYILIDEIKKFNPDVIHIHNIHGFYLDMFVLFSFLKKSNIKIIWTLHDCWPYTGHCAYYIYKHCNQWQIECKSCKDTKDYPPSLASHCNKNFKKKKELFCGLNNLTIICPSQWLADDVKKSFLKEYPIKVIHNGIDTEIFQPNESDILNTYDLNPKKIILGVASVWDKRKGLDYFLELDKRLSDEYKIVLIGLTDKQIKKLPDSILGIKRTENAEELAKWYSAAEVFFNPTLEDNYPTTNLEAIACGTPVVTFNTGGSPESAFVPECGYCIKKNVDAFLNILQDIKPIKSIPKNIDMEYMCNSYIDLYK